MDTNRSEWYGTAHAGYIEQIREEEKIAHDSTRIITNE
jgi:hypothetical protein